MKYGKEDFKALVRLYIKRDGIDQLMQILENTDFYKAPASTKYHDSCEGGLVYHSVSVFHRLYDEVKLYPELGISDESIAIVALFHDLCKMGFYKVSSRNVKDEKTGKWSSVPYYEVDDMFPFGHGEKSAFLIQDCVRLTPTEALAIRWHMGGFSAKEEYMALSKCYETTPLALLLHVADMKATYLK